MEVISGVLPFVVLMFLFLILTVMFPAMSTWLPSVMG
jgi:TRAP-type C4-dicarboxylate transport system permease large subunit